MDQAARVAFIMSQVVCAQAEIEAMKAHNEHCKAIGTSQFYSEEAFMAVPDKYCLGHNSVIMYLRES